MSNSGRGRSALYKNCLVSVLAGLMGGSVSAPAAGTPQDPPAAEESPIRQGLPSTGFTLDSWAQSLRVPSSEEPQVPVFFVVRPSKDQQAEQSLEATISSLVGAIEGRDSEADEEDLKSALVVPLQRSLAAGPLVEWGGVACFGGTLESPLLKTLAMGFEAAARDAGEHPVEPIFDIPAPPSSSAYGCKPHGGGPVNLGHTGLGQAVAILDSGVDSAHPFFRNLRAPHPSGATKPASRVVSEACYSTDADTKISPLCPDGDTKSTSPGSGVNCLAPLAWCEHGTHEAGIAAGSDPRSGYPDYSGIAREASLISIQVFSKVDNVGYCQDPQPCILSLEADRIRALNRVYELSQEAKGKYRIAAVFMGQSVGQYETQAKCEERHICIKLAIDRLASVGIPVIVPSGNDHERERLGAPACFSSTVSVGATNDKDEVAGFSNVAPPGRLDLLAPGVGIGGAVPTGFEPGDAQVGCRSGTSMAAARVAGAFALLAEAEPTASAYDILDALRSTGVPIDDERPGGEAEDLPRIDVCAALRLLTNSSEPCP